MIINMLCDVVMFIQYNMLGDVIIMPYVAVMIIGSMNILLPLVVPYDVDIYTKSRCNLLVRCVSFVTVSCLVVVHLVY
ncbi:hypothetical protein Hanom_Chr05g00391271 [Helianthus anomalus]